MEANIGNIMTSLDGADDEHTEADVHGMPSRLNLLLVSRCREEALEVVKAVDQNGFLAWQRLYRKYSPKTMARAIHLLMAVTHPPKVKELSSIDAALGRWETTQRQLKKEFDEEMTERMKIATITSMLPPVVQDYVLQNLDDRARASEVIEKVRAWVNNHGWRWTTARGPWASETRAAKRGFLAAERGYERQRGSARRGAAVGFRVRRATHDVWRLGPHRARLPNRNEGRKKGEGKAQKRGAPRGRGQGSRGVGHTDFGYSRAKAPAKAKASEELVSGAGKQGTEPPSAQPS